MIRDRQARAAALDSPEKSKTPRKFVPSAAHGCCRQPAPLRAELHRRSVESGRLAHRYIRQLKGTATDRPWTRWRRGKPRRDAACAGRNHVGDDDGAQREGFRGSPRSPAVPTVMTILSQNRKHTRSSVGLDDEACKLNARRSSRAKMPSALAESRRLSCVASASCARLVIVLRFQDIYMYISRVV